MAKPAYDASNQRDAQIIFRVPPGAAEAIREQARQAGMSLSGFIRAMLIAGPVVVSRDRSLSLSVRQELQKICVNLRQLLQHADPSGQQRPILSLYERIDFLVEDAFATFSERKGNLSGNQKTKRLICRVTEDQHDVIEARAKQVNLDISGFAREMLMGGQVTIKKILELDPAYVAAINQLGKRLNELTERANSRKRIPYELTPMLEELNIALDTFKE